MAFWWEENSTRYEEELAAFSRRGASINIDVGEKASGSIVLNVIWPDPGGELELIVRYPHRFPFFRPGVVAPRISLRYHRSPSGDLCLLPQWTGAWRPEDLVADYIFEQLPKVLKAGRSEDKDEVADIEEHQAVPVSGYYPCYPETHLVIDGSWEIDQSVRSGYLEIGVPGMGIPDPKEIVRQGIRGAVLQVQDLSGNRVAALPDSIRALYPRVAFKAPWVRLSHAPEENTQNAFWKALQDEFPREFIAVDCQEPL